ncbi:MAG: GMC family oxidoreductase [Bacteroidetes bacterium]|nr:GMC family oxidoreductase [Bacteroidota bacterium]MDA1121482.1 GMC family oxidoreductase [Bacteroidota bacterium]
MSVESVNVNGKGIKQNTFDAIVIGAGMSGGWAAKEFCEKGLKTLVLERGRNVEHIKDYPTANKEDWEFEHRRQLPHNVRSENPILDRCYAWDESTEHFFVKDNEHPYIQKKPFSWVKGYQVGGKSLMWARMTQRWSDLDFEANAKEGIGSDWPIRYKDIAPWYSYVEKFVGISGNKDGLSQIPDGEFLPPLEMNCLEKHFKKTIEEKYPGRNLVTGRCANLTQAHNGRNQCQNRTKCRRGCPLGGYFSANSSTMPAAIATGNLTLRPFSVVHSVIYDETKNRATGVRVIDSETKETFEYYARVIFVNASTINTTLVLLNSTSNRFPNGLGNDSDALGRYLMDHNYRARLSAEHDGFTDQYYYGRKPTSCYLPRFRNFNGDKQDSFIRGYAYSLGASRSRGNVQESDEPIGADYKEKLTQVGPWRVGLTGMGECLPYADNRITLSKDQTDQWGMPLIEIDAEFKENEEAMVEDILDQGEEMLDAAGFKDIQKSDSKNHMGLGIHEMGTARMGKDPKNSVLNGNNQLHAVKNVFVTDGASMASTACQNPSITYMALTARATDFAVSEMNKGNL